MKILKLPTAFFVFLSLAILTAAYAIASYLTLPHAAISKTIEKADQQNDYIIEETSDPFVTRVIKK